jgi:hypothetical protein
VVPGGCTGFGEPPLIRVRIEGGKAWDALQVLVDLGGREGHTRAGSWRRDWAAGGGDG